MTCLFCIYFGGTMSDMQSVRQSESKCNGFILCRGDLPPPTHLAHHTTCYRKLQLDYNTTGNCTHIWRDCNVVVCLCLSSTIFSKWLVKIIVQFKDERNLAWITVQYFLKPWQVPKVVMFCPADLQMFKVKTYCFQISFEIYLNMMEKEKKSIETHFLPATSISDEDQPK